MVVTASLARTCGLILALSFSYAAVVHVGLDVFIFRVVGVVDSESPAWCFGVATLSSPQRSTHSRTLFFSCDLLCWNRAMSTTIFSMTSRHNYEHAVAHVLLQVEQPSRPGPLKSALVGGRRPNYYTNAGCPRKQVGGDVEASPRQVCSTTTTQLSRGCFFSRVPVAFYVGVSSQGFGV